MKFDEQVGYINLCLVVSQIPLQRLVANYCGLVDDILTYQDSLPCRRQVRNKLATSQSTGKLLADVSNEFWA